MASIARFFIASELSIGTSIELPIDIVHHMQILRLRLGDKVILFNGNGYEYTANITKFSKNFVITYLEHTHIAVADNSKFSLTLCISLIANDKMDMAIQKSIELGVNKIIPIISQYSKRVDADKIVKKLEHWRKIIINSSEQCGANKIAEITAPVNFQKLITQNAKNSIQELKLIASPHNNASKLPKIAPQNISLIIGPEGGFTQDEVTQAFNAQYLNLYLGSRILRAETAVIASISVLNTLYDNFL